VNEPRGLCLSCGAPDGIRLAEDCRKRPFLKCSICATVLFVRGDGAAFKWLAALCNLAKQPTQKVQQEILPLANEIAMWGSERFAPATAPAVARAPGIPVKDGEK